MSKMNIDDISLIEINGAFAAMPLVRTKILAKNENTLLQVIFSCGSVFNDRKDISQRF